MKARTTARLGCSPTSFLLARSGLQLLLPTNNNNSGKSQLLNLMTQSVVAAVSRKRHTTREGIMGSRIVTDAMDGSVTQLLFVDTPGFLRQDAAKKEGVRGTVVSTAKREIKNVDFTLIVVDAAARLTEPVKRTILELMIKAVNAKGRPKEEGEELEATESDLAVGPLENEGVDDNAERAETTNDDSPDLTTTTADEVSAFEVSSRVDDEEGGNDSTKILNDDRNDCAATVDEVAAIDMTKSSEEDEAQSGRDHVPKDEEIAKSKEQPEEEEDNSLQNFAIVLNKTDLVRPKQLLINMAMELFEMAEACIKGYKGQTDEKEIAAAATIPAVGVVQEQDEAAIMEGMPTFFYTDCKHNDGIEEIVKFLKRRATPCQEFEVEEVPYHVSQVNRSFQHVVDSKTGQPGLRIEQILIVQTHSHLHLLKGRNLVMISSAARRDLIKNFQCPVDLVLTVKLARSSERTWSV
jgi:GTPase Era involved in 16S rRNA processing